MDTTNTPPKINTSTELKVQKEPLLKEKSRTTTSGSSPRRMKKDVSNGPKVGLKLKKAPGAPRRFKTAFIFFSTAKHKEFREALGKQGSKVKATNIAKMVGKAWKELSKEERAVWDDIAAKDKARYELERSTYKGPWQVVDTGRDPMAPRRPCSAFINFLNYKRDQVKKENPNASSIEVMRITAKLWRDDVPERELFEARAVKERENYRKETEHWKEMQQRKPEVVMATQREEMAWSALEGGVAPKDFPQIVQEEQKGLTKGAQVGPAQAAASDEHAFTNVVRAAAAMNSVESDYLPSLPLSCASNNALLNMASCRGNNNNPFVNKRNLSHAAVSSQLVAAERILRSRSLQHQASMLLQLSSDPLMEAMGMPAIPQLSMGSLSSPAMQIELGLLQERLRRKRELLILKLLEEGR